MKLIVRHIVILLACVLNIHLVLGQEFTYKLNSKTGLASDEAYSVLQDQKGKMWFTTDNGISVFNGFSITNYTIKDGMLDNVVFKQCEDNKGRIWFGSLNRKLFFFEGTKFKPALNSKKEVIAIPTKEIMEMFAVKDTVFISTSYGTYKLNQKGGFFKLSKIPPSNTNDDLLIRKIHGHYCVLHLKEIKRKEFYNICIEDGTKKKHYSTKFSEEFRSMFKIVRSFKSDTYISIGKYLFRCNDGKIVEKVLLPNEIIHFEFMNNNGDVFTKHNGFYQLKKGQFKDYYKVFYKNLTISQRFIDREGGTWLTTLENGVLYDASYTKGLLFLYTKERYPMTLLVSNGDKEIWQSSKKGDLFRIAGNQFGTDIYNSKLGEEINDLAVSDKFLVVNGSLNISIYDIANKQFKLVSKLNRTSYGISNIRNDQFYISDGEYIELYRKNKLVKKIPFNQRIYDLYQDKNVLYFGTNSGLYSYDGDKINSIYIKALPIGERVQVIKERGGKLYIGTKTSGLFIYDVNSKKVQNVREGKKGLIDYCINAIEFLEGENFAIGTPKGLSVMTKTKKGFTISNFNTTDGMVSEQVKSLCYFQGYLIWGTNEGLFGWPLNQISINKVAPITTIDRVDLIGSKTFRNELEYDDNNLKISFSSSAFRQFGKVRVKYRLQKGESFFYTLNNSNGELNLSNLEPGDYSVEIYSSNNSGIWSLKPATLEFSIAYPFWQRWPFFLMLSFTLGLAIYTLLYTRFQRFKKKEREKAAIRFEIEQLKMRALRLQINPHFLFNALNNIQGYYASGDILKAKDYIYHLSRFLRLMLETSKDENITMDQEVDIVNFYVELNRFRYENNFLFKLLKINTDNSHELEVPPMITQPFIENAFIHARSESEKLKISLCFRYKNDLLEIEIQDNGSSMTKESLNKLIQSGPTNGVGITIERIIAFNSKNDYSGVPVEFKITAEGGLQVKLFLKQTYAN